MSSDVSSLLSAGSAFIGVFFFMFGLVMLIVAVIIISLWKIFTKAGQPGWAAIVPYYGYYIQTVKVARASIWYFIVACVPTLLAITRVPIPEAVEGALGTVTFVMYAIVVYKMAKMFGKGIGYTIGLVLLPFIFYPMLAFGDSVYLSNETADAQPVQPPVDTSVPVTPPLVEAPASQVVAQQEVPENSQTQQS